MSKVILSLCDFTGNWPRPYYEAGYTVILVDPKHKTRTKAGRLIKLPFTAEDLADYLLDEVPGKVYGLLMAPPCTHFTVSGAQYWKAKDADGRTEEGKRIIRACLDIKDELAPAFWALENPVGRLPRLFPTRLGRPQMYFNPCDYGDAYTKKTGLWGDSNTDLPKTPVDPERVCSQGS